MKLLEAIEKIIKPKSEAAKQREQEFKKAYDKEKLKLAPKLAKAKAEAEHDAEVQRIKVKNSPPNPASKGGVNGQKKGFAQHLKEWGNAFEESARQQRASLQFADNTKQDSKSRKMFSEKIL